MDDTVEEELKNELDKIAKGLVKYVSEEMLNLLQVHILEDTYQYGGKNKYYLPSRDQEPSYEFINAFNLSSNRKILNGYMQDLLYNWQDMHVWAEYYETEDIDPDTGNMVTTPRTTVAHGYIDSDTGRIVDLREKLFDILNVKYDPKKERQPFWDNFIKELPSKVPVWAKKYLDRTGLEYKIDFDFGIDVKEEEDNGGVLPF